MLSPMLAFESIREIAALNPVTVVDNTAISGNVSLSISPEVNVETTPVGTRPPATAEVKFTSRSTASMDAPWGI